MDFTEIYILSLSVRAPPFLRTNYKDKEVEIIHHLRITILQYSPPLTEVSRLLGELDWYPHFVSSLTKVFLPWHSPRRSTISHAPS